MQLQVASGRKITRLSITEYLHMHDILRLQVRIKDMKKLFPGRDLDQVGPSSFPFLDPGLHTNTDLDTIYGFFIYILSYRNLLQFEIGA